MQIRRVIIIHATSLFFFLLFRQSPVGSLSYGGMPAGGVLIGGSPYSTSVRDHPTAASVPAYSMWGSDSSQLYRPGSKDSKDKKQVCSTLLITTATLVVTAILAIAAVAAYLGGETTKFNTAGIKLIMPFLFSFLLSSTGYIAAPAVMTNHSDGDKCKSRFLCTKLEGDPSMPSSLRFTRTRSL